jgi:hypothetical protein
MPCERNYACVLSTQGPHDKCFYYFADTTSGAGPLPKTVETSKVPNCSVCWNSGFGAVKDTPQHQAFHREHLARFPQSSAFLYEDGTGQEFDDRDRDDQIAEDEDWEASDDNETEEPERLEDGEN